MQFLATSVLPRHFGIQLKIGPKAARRCRGPLSICGQESSLRIVAWSFALYSFLHSPATTSQRLALLLSMIASHAWRSLQTTGYARSQRSNHLFSESVGLFTAGTLYPELRDSLIWQQHGIRLLREAVLDQLTPDGCLLQDSFNYQRIVLHVLLWTLLLAEDIFITFSLTPKFVGVQPQAWISLAGS